MEQLRDIVGEKFLRKKQSEKDKENTKVTEECDREEFSSCTLLAFFFSANWCPPCKSFTPILREFYNEVNSDEKRFEVIFVSFDEAHDQFLEHYNGMPWMALPFEDPRGKSLKEKFMITGIPSLVVVDPITWKEVSKKGRKDVQELGQDVFDEWLKKIAPPPAE